METLDTESDCGLMWVTTGSIPALRFTSFANLYVPCYGMQGGYCQRPTTTRRCQQTGRTRKGRSLRLKPRRSPSHPRRRLQPVGLEPASLHT